MKWHQLRYSGLSWGGMRGFQMQRCQTKIFLLKAEEGLLHIWFGLSFCNSNKQIIILSYINKCNVQSSTRLLWNPNIYCLPVALIWYWNNSAVEWHKVSSLSRAIYWSLPGLAWLKFVVDPVIYYFLALHFKSLKNRQNILYLSENYATNIKVQHELKLQGLINNILTSIH